MRRAVAARAQALQSRARAQPAAEADGREPETGARPRRRDELERAAVRFGDRAREPEPEPGEPDYARAAREQIEPSGRLPGPSSATSTTTCPPSPPPRLDRRPVAEPVRDEVREHLTEARRVASTPRSYPATETATPRSDVDRQARRRRPRSRRSETGSGRRGSVRRPGAPRSRGREPASHRGGPSGAGGGERPRAQRRGCAARARRPRAAPGRPLDPPLIRSARRRTAPRGGAPQARRSSTNGPASAVVRAPWFPRATSAFRRSHRGTFPGTKAGRAPRQLAPVALEPFRERDRRAVASSCTELRRSRPRGSTGRGPDRCRSRRHGPRGRPSRRRAFPRVCVQ